MATMSDVLGIGVSMIIDWIYHRKAGLEVGNMCTNDQDEQLKVYSYFPYHSDFGFVTKSAYSSVASSHFYFLVQAIG